MSTIIKGQRTLREKLFFVFSVLLFAVLNLVPGLTHSYADAQCGGGGGGTPLCPGCTGSGSLCCTVTTRVCDINGQNCSDSTYKYYYP